jgi:hypothetical protein
MDLLHDPCGATGFNEITQLSISNVILSGVSFSMISSSAKLFAVSGEKAPDG